MQRKTLDERLASLEARKAVLQQQEARLKEQARKKRVRDLIALGELVDKAGLADWPADKLLAALTGIANGNQQGAGERSQPGGVAGAS